MEPSPYCEDRSPNSQHGRSASNGLIGVGTPNGLLEEFESTASPNGDNALAKLPIKNPLCQSSSHGIGRHSGAQKTGSHREAPETQAEQIPPKAESGPSKLRAGTDQSPSSSSAMMPFKKPDYDAQALTRQLRLDEEPKSAHRVSSHISNGHATGESSIKKSMSWAQASGQSPRHLFELTPDLRPSDHASIASGEKRARRSDNAGLNYWVHDGRNGFHPGDYTLPVQEGWDYVRCIPKEKIVHLAMQYKPPGAKSGALIQYEDGQNNLVAIVKFDNDTKYCIRLPACGSKGMWNNAAKATLLNVVDTMRYIKATTKLLMPEVIAYDASFDNAIGAPFVIMSFVQGRPIHEKWWNSNTQDFVTVSPELEETRQKILKSIANQVVLLKHLEFDGYGEFRLNNGQVSEPAVVPVKMRPFANVLESYEMKKQAKRFSQFVLGGQSDGDARSSESSSDSQHGVEVSPSSYDVWVQILREWFSTALHLAMENDVFHSPEEDPMIGRIRGIFSLYSLLIKYLPYAPGTKESYPDEERFVMAQTDFNPQNIFVDEECNVAGFIDWDFTDTKPRYMGWARQPVWLCEDWDRDKVGIGSRTWPNITATASCEFDRYRKDYARYLIEACGRHNDDWRFVLKCHIFEAVTMSIGRTSDMEQLLVRLLNYHIGPFDWDAHFIDLGRNGFNPGLQNFYEDMFKKILECDPYTVKAELGMLNITTELQAMSSIITERDQANEDVQRTQKELINMYREQLALCSKQVAILQEALARQRRDESPTAEQEQRSTLNSPQSRLRNRAHDSRPPLTDCAPVIRSRPATILDIRRQEYRSPPSPDVSVHSWRSDEEYVMSGALRPETPPLDRTSSPVHNLFFDVPRPRPRLRSPPPCPKQSRWKSLIKKAQARIRELKHKQVNTTSSRSSSYPEHLADFEQAILPVAGARAKRARATDADRRRGLVANATEKVKRACKNAYQRWKMRNEGTRHEWDLYTYGAYDPDQRSDSVLSDDLYSV